VKQPSQKMASFLVALHECYWQNRRQKVINRGLYLLAVGLDIQI